MKRFYDLHVFLSRKDGFSVPVEIETDLVGELDDDVIIGVANVNGLIDDEDALLVDTVREIDEDEFNQMKNI